MWDWEWGVISCAGHEVPPPPVPCVGLTAGGAISCAGHEVPPPPVPCSVWVSLRWGAISCAGHEVCEVK